MSRVLTVASVQAKQRQASDGLTAFAAEVTELAATLPKGALIQYPEVHLAGIPGLGDSLTEYKAIAEPIAGPRIKALAELAGDLGIWLAPGTFAEPAEDGGVYNTAVVLSPQGETAAVYRKMFPWRPSEVFRPGVDFTTFDIPNVGRIGVCICYDIWFPEVCRNLAWLGAEVVLNTVWTTTPDRHQEVQLIPANAIMNQVFVVSTNGSAPVGWGQSMIVGPEGEVLARSYDAAPCVQIAELDLDEVSRVREIGTAGTNRMWSQFTAADRTVQLPLYAGRIDPQTWEPRG